MRAFARAALRQGTSLLEICICVILLAVALIPLLRGQMATSAATRFTRDEATAAALLSMSLERFRNESPGVLAEADLNVLASGDPLLSPGNGEASLGPTSPTTANLNPAQSTRRFLDAVNRRFERDLRFEVLGRDENGSVTHGCLQATIRWTDTRDGSRHERKTSARLLLHERFPQ